MFTHDAIEHVRTVVFSAYCLGPIVLGAIVTYAHRVLPTRLEPAIAEKDAQDAHVAVQTARTLIEAAARVEVRNARLAQAGRHSEARPHLPGALRRRAALLLCTTVGGASFSGSPGSFVGPAASDTTVIERSAL